VPYHVAARKGQPQQNRPGEEDSDQLFVPQKNLGFVFAALQHFYFELY
jgi:hypothetical protein